MSRGAGADQVRAACAALEAEGLAAECLEWVDGKLKQAEELWAAMAASHRSTCDDFSLVPVADVDWDMVEVRACPPRPRRRPPGSASNL